MLGYARAKKSVIPFLTCTFTLIASCLAGPLPAQMHVVYPRQERGLEKQNDYFFELLQLLLESTKKEFGAYTLAYSAQAMNMPRIEAELSIKNGRIDTSVLGWTTSRAEKYHQIKIPVDRGLLGYRLLLIRGMDQKKFSTFKTLEDLKPVHFGLLNSWSDAKILAFNGLTVTPGNSFEGLFKMLVAGRFDAFSRDITEIEGEFEQYGKELPSLAIENTLLLHYPAARYFFVARTPQGVELGNRIEAGLKTMEQDGSMNALFIKHRGQQIAKFKLGDRRVIELLNPSLPPELMGLPKNLLPPWKE